MEEEILYTTRRGRYHVSSTQKKLRKKNIPVALTPPNQNSAVLLTPLSQFYKIYQALIFFKGKIEQNPSKQELKCPRPFSQRLKNSGFIIKFY
jgi:hypothetical protein